MRIMQIQNRINNNSSYRQNGEFANHTDPNFGRRLRKDEEADFQKTNKEGFKAAGAEQRIAITHGSVFPALGRDSFIGSPYGKSAMEYTKFLILNGFNGNQLGPNGRLLEDSISPYNASALNENHLFIELEPLTTEKYGKILSKETYERITDPIKTNDKNYSFSDFAEAKKTYYVGLNEAYRTFKTKLAKGQPESIQLNKEFDKFLTTNGKRTEEEGLFRALSGVYGTENLHEWDNELDKNLMVEVRKENPAALERYNDLTLHYKKSIEEYKFEQFIADKQIKENKTFREDIGFKYFSDLLVGCSNMDLWRYKEAFLEGYEIGACESNDNPHQIWKIPALNPRMLFKGYDGLNIGGEFLKEKLNHSLENCDNVRIDHALGLIEPFVYKADTVHYDENGNQLKNEIKCAYMSNITGDDGDKLDNHYDYPNILKRLVLPTLKEHGLEKNAPVWEHICSEPDLFKKIYYGEQQLPRLIQTEYMKDEFAGDHHWYLVGSHDSQPAMNMLDADGGWRRTNPAWDALYLAGYLNQDPTRADESKIFCETIAADDKELIKAKFAELFTKKKIQVSFADILGITDPDVVYNVGGSKSDMNWKERIAPDFIEKYYENLSSDNPTALNMPEILGKAVQANIDKKVVNFINSIPDSDPDKQTKIIEKREELNANYKPLIAKLKHYEEVLKEKEEVPSQDAA